MFKENKIAYLKPKFVQLCELNIFKKIYVYTFWIVYVMKFQKTEKEEILCELKVALREKLRKLFILMPSPKDKYYDMIPLILSLAIEITLNAEITTITEPNKVGAPPKNTYDYECKQDLFQTVYYEILGFLPSAYFIENLILKYTQEENKLGINTNYMKDKKKAVIKKPILKGIKKNLCNVLDTFYKDQSRNTQSPNLTSKTSLYMSPSRLSNLDLTTSFTPNTTRDLKPTPNSIKFDTSTLSPCFDHIYKSYQQPSPLTQSSNFSSYASTTNPNFTSSLQFPPLRKPLKVQVLKPSHSMILRHRSEYEVDQGKKCHFQVMFEEFENESKKRVEEVKRKEAKEKSKIKQIRRLRKITEEGAFGKKGTGKGAKGMKGSEVQRRRRATLVASKRESVMGENKDEEEEPIERKWIVGKTIAVDGTVANSPGLEKIVEHIEICKTRPKRISENAFKKKTYSQKFNSQQFVQNQIDRISEYLGREFVPNKGKLERMKRMREQKQKIISRFLDVKQGNRKGYSIVIENLLKEINMICKTESVISSFPKSFQILSPRYRNPEAVPEIENPDIPEDKLDYQFEKVWQKFLKEIRQEQGIEETEEN